MLTKRLLAFGGLSTVLGAAAWSCANNAAPGYGGSTSSSGSSSSGSTSGSTSGSSSGGTSGGSGSTSSGGGSGSTSSSGTSGSGSSSGSASGGACVVQSMGGLPLTGSKQNFLSGMGYSGYAFVFQDSKTASCGTPGGKACGTSTGCLETGFFCGSGMTGIKNGGITYGAGFGADLGQMMGGASGGGEGGAAEGGATEGGATEGGTSTNNPVPTTGTGLTYAISATPATGPMFGLEITINQGAYCTKTTSLSGTIPWSQFVQRCSSPSDAGAPFPATGGMISSVIFRANAGLTAAPYDFCITMLGI